MLLTNIYLKWCSSQFHMISWPIRIQTNIQSFEYVLLMYVLPKRKGLRISKCVLKYLQFTTRHVYKCCCQNPFRTPQKMHTLPPLLWPLYSNISTGSGFKLNHPINHRYKKNISWKWTWVPLIDCLIVFLCDFHLIFMLLLILCDSLCLWMILLDFV